MNVKNLIQQMNYMLSNKLELMYNRFQQQRGRVILGATLVGAAALAYLVPWRVFINRFINK
jgi:hypothetical protein